MRLFAVAVVLAGCGRVAFDPLADAGQSYDGTPDAASPCPPGFVFVAGSAQLGSTDFCAMQFEAKARDMVTGEIALAGCDAQCTQNSLVTTHVPAGVPEGDPWHEIDAVQSRLRCRALGAGYDLMANREWMTIARDVERVGANWSSGTPGLGRVVEGTTDGSLGGAVTDPNDPYSDTGNSAADPPGSGWEQRRTIVLASGAWIWDMPGDVQEWVDWTVGEPLDGAPTPCTGAELPAFTCANITNDDFNSSTGTYDSTNGVGKVIGGSGDATRRGGQRSDQAFGYAGIYGLNMNRFTIDTFPATGFRCVLRL